MGGRGASSGAVRRASQPAPTPPPIPQRRRAQPAPPPTPQQTQQTTGGGPYGGHGNLQGLVQAMNQAQQNSGTRSSSTGFNAGEGSSAADYTAGGNQALMKWQGQTDTSKTSRYLAKLGKMQTPSRDSEGYTYHQSPYQNMVIDQGLNAPVYATLSKAEFTRYCNQTNQTPFYRGWSGSASKLRFENAKAFHTGTGMYGEGIYFGSKSTANSYGSTQTKAALSPNARVVDINTVQRALRNSGSSRAFSNSGRTNSSFSNNSGEAQMALKMGYNVIRTSWSYVVLTRDAVVISK